MSVTTKHNQLGISRSLLYSSEAAKQDQSLARLLPHVQVPLYLARYRGKRSIDNRAQGTPHNTLPRSERRDLWDVTCTVHGRTWTYPAP